MWLCEAKGQPAQEVPVLLTLWFRYWCNQQLLIWNLKRQKWPALVCFSYLKASLIFATNGTFDLSLAADKIQVNVAWRGHSCRSRDWKTGAWSNMSTQAGAVNCKHKSVLPPSGGVLRLHETLCVNLLITHIGAFYLFQNGSCDWGDCWSGPSLASVFHEVKSWWDEYTMLGSRSHMARSAVECLGVSVMWTRSTGSLLSSCHALIYKSVHLCEEESSFIPDGCTTWMLHPRLSDFLAAQRHVLPPPWLFVTPAVWKVCVLFSDFSFTTVVLPPGLLEWVTCLKS